MLPALDLSLEKGTKTVPDDRAWYLLRAGQQIGRYRREAEARAAWAALVAESGWVPPKRKADPNEILRSESKERWARNRAG